MEETKESNPGTPKSKKQVEQIDEAAAQEQEELQVAKEVEKQPAQKEKLVQIKTERSFKTLEQIYSNNSKKGQSGQFFRTSDQFDRKVVHDQINNSHAKQHYSFAKAERFSKTKQSYCVIQFYDSQVTSSLDKRAASLGFGQKSDFTKCDKYIPGPSTYNTSWQMNKGVKFAFGRAETAKQGLLGGMNKNPGPGMYQLGDCKSKIKYSLGDRTSAKHIYIQSTTPAPGTYQIGGMHPKGNYFVGKYKSSGATVFSPMSAQSIRYKRTPGPGTYNPPGNVGEQGNQLPSKYTSQSGNRFGIGERQTQQIKNKAFPGPGSYQLPSEFGDFEYPPL